MKLSCTKENLAQGLAVTSNIGTKNVNLPILNNVLIKADNGGIHFTATNLEIAVKVSIRGKVEQVGEYTIPSKLFFDFVNLLPDERVDIDLHDDGAFIACATAKTKLKGVASSEFPLIPSVTDGSIFTVSVSELRKVLSQTLFSAANNESRPELSGLNFNFEITETTKSLTIASTDSYRLAEAKIGVKTDVMTGRSVIIPSRTLSELNRIFGVFKDDVEASDTVDIEISDNQIVFRYGSVELISRIIEGQYPDYKQIIPTEFKTSATVNRQALIKAVKSTSLFSKNGLYDVELAVSPEGGKIELSASDATRGEHSLTLPGTFTGELNRIVLNYRYVLDGLGAMNADEVEVRVIDASNPCLVVPKASEEQEKEGYKYVVMPIRR